VCFGVGPQLLEDKGTGVFSMIDEEINVPKGSDDTYLNKVKQKHGKHENFVVPKPKQCNDPSKCFGIKHYAGEVFYNVNNFLEKNKDTLHADIVNALQSSSLDFMNSELFPRPREEAGPAARNRGRAPGPSAKTAKITLGSQFKTQLGSLMETLNSTFPHFVRCMKPNALKKGSIFQSQMMLAQLRYAGLLEVCRIRKLGFPIRREFDGFVKRYRCMVPGVTDVDTMLARLMEMGKLREGMWAKGNTKVGTSAACPRRRCCMTEAPMRRGPSEHCMSLVCI
jgi:myosin heavy subunit